MKILHVTPAFYPATYWGGPIYSVYELCNALVKHEGVELRVLTSDSAGPKEAVPFDSTPVRYNAGYDVYFNRRIIGAEFAPRLLLRLFKMARWADVIHLTGVYSIPTIPTLLVARMLRKPVVWSPRGALQRWDKSTKPRAKKLWEYICRLLLNSSRSCLHVTSKEEGISSKERMPGVCVKVIPNGIHTSETNTQGWREGGKLRLLYVGRLHQIKGIENLIHAIADLPDYICLTICGDGEEKYKKSLLALVNKFNLAHRICFKGHVTGDSKLKCFKRADVCVVPSYTENFGMVIAESMAHGIPVIASTGTPWKEVVNKGCGWWVNNDKESLLDAIRSAESANLHDMGEKGALWMKEAFSWESVAKEIIELYQILIHQDASVVDEVST